MKSLVVPATAALALALGACGTAAPEAVVVPNAASAASGTPPPALAPGTLGRIPDVAIGHTRIGYVNTAALASFGGPLSADATARLVLGRGATRLAAATDEPATAVQVGDATVLTGASRTVVGGSPALRAALAPTTPDTSLITDETPSAVQSCLADAAAEAIVGSAVLGRSAGIGVGLFDSADAPAGRKLLVCVAPHFVRELDPTMARLHRRFDDPSLPAAQRPKIGGAEIGEREIVTAAVSLDSVDPGDLRDLLRGGPSLTALAGS